MDKIAIITTGDELLKGEKSDTNSGFLAHELNQLGMIIDHHITVGDNQKDLKRILEMTLNKVNIVLITGGLGPTLDDNTIAALQDLFKFEIHYNGVAKEKICKVFQMRGRDINEADLKMAQVPIKADVIENHHGLAPGFILKENNKTIIALPGVPGEMKEMVHRDVIPYLKNNFQIEDQIINKFKIVGLKESEIDENVEKLNEKNNNFQWGITAEQGVATLFLITKEKNNQNMVTIRNEFATIFKHTLLGEGFNLPQEELLYLLKIGKKTISVAESCTGGLIAKNLTDISGSSDVFFGGIIAYSNEIKEKLLGVDKACIESFGAVSEEVVKEMARGIRKVCNTDIGISVSGIAGPGGGTESKPIGTVCFGFDFDGKIITMTERFSGNRESVRNFSSLFVIDYVRKYMLLN